MVMVDGLGHQLLSQSLSKSSYLGPDVSSHSGSCARLEGGYVHWGRFGKKGGGGGNGRTGEGDTRQAEIPTASSIWSFLTTLPSQTPYNELGFLLDSPLLQHVRFSFTCHCFLTLSPFSHLHSFAARDCNISVIYPSSTSLGPQSTLAFFASEGPSSFSVLSTNPASAWTGSVVSSSGADRLVPCWS